MTDAASSAPARAAGFLRRYPVVTLLILLAVLTAGLQVTSLIMYGKPIVNQLWFGNRLNYAIALAMLAACQTITMFTGGIDLSAAVVATIVAFVTATLTPSLGAGPAILVAMLPALAVGLLNGFGIGVCRVHPLIMTLGSGLIATGFLLVYQRTVIATGTEVPAALVWLGTGRTLGLPNVLVVFLPFAAFLIWAQGRWGFGRLLYAVGANENAARLSGVRIWQVHMALYLVAALIAGLTGLVYVGQIRQASLSLALPLLLPAVAATVIGGTSIFGGRGSYAGTIVGAMILAVLVSLLTLLQIPEGARRILFGAVILAVTAVYVRLSDQG
ncbi:MAG: ABC transporter permease [Rhodobacteraceae bacterium]|nr:ABC transporter permease [Paracoccaceae bacterium]